MKKILLHVLYLLLAGGMAHAQATKVKVLPKAPKGFVRICGQNLVKPTGEKLFIKGINLGNWLNPEGYMLLLKNSANSYRLIDEAFKEMVGEAVTDDFWRAFQKSYVTRQDIRYIRQTGMNTIRLPFHYKLLTNESYMGYASKAHGYAVLDSVVSWCRQEGLYVILDMHDAPGGQTGSNIDDSYGYPWLLVTESQQQQFCQLWREVAKRYAHNPTVLAYDLLNEPIASSVFPQDTARLNANLAALFQRVIKVVRQVDTTHIVMVSGSYWGQDYSIFKKNWQYDDKLMFTCHRYHSDTTEAGIKDFLAYRTRFNRPFYMGETGHESDQWIAGFCHTLARVNIGWTFWPYKKMGNATSMLTIATPVNWKLLLDYSDADRRSFALMQEKRPNQQRVREAMDELIYNMRYNHCTVNAGYIRALGMNPTQAPR